MLPVAGCFAGGEGQGAVGDRPAAACRARSGPAFALRRPKARLAVTVHRLGVVVGVGQRDGAAAVALDRGATAPAAAPSVRGRVPSSSPAAIPSERKARVPGGVPASAVFRAATAGSRLAGRGRGWAAASRVRARCRVGGYRIVLAVDGEDHGDRQRRAPSASSIMAGGRVGRGAASRRRVAQLLSMTSTSGPEAESVFSRGLSTGSAIARMTAAAISMRKRQPPGAPRRRLLALQDRGEDAEAAERLSDDGLRRRQPQEPPDRPAEATSAARTAG